DFWPTSKTAFLVDGDYQLDRFVVDHSRNADSNRIYAGFRVESETRLFGRAVGGVRLFRPRDLTRGSNRQVPYASVDLSYRAGPRTLLNALYAQDLDYSAFNPSGALPTLRLTTYGARLEKGLVGHVELFVYGRLIHLRTDAAITVVRANGGRTTQLRDDHVRE